MSVVLELTFEIPAETIRIETHNDAAQLSEEDLFWCFGGFVSFLDSRTKSVLLTLDACLLGFTFDFAEALHLLRRKAEVKISDREGGYLIRLVNVGSDVELRSQELVVFTAVRADLEREFAAFVRVLTVELTTLFPRLLEGGSFTKLVRDIEAFIAEQQ